ncbi:MAG: hypothetical protein GPJ54_19720 [Candidatus Heimdallarchaeota archaeon]|nr:hypothetical protein [Candidatus Heimdallarchaeota archaeon]
MRYTIMARAGLFCLLVLLSLNVSVNAQQYIITISNNPSFENWSDELPDDWILKYNSDTTSIYQSTDVDSGDFALGITVEASSFELISISQNISIKQNTNYEFSVVFKGTFVVDSELYFEWTWFNNTGLPVREEIEPSKLIINKNTTFDDFFGVIQRPISPDNTTSMMLTFNLWTNDAVVVIDDFVASYESDDPPETSNSLNSNTNETSSSESIIDSDSDDGFLDFMQNLPLVLVSLLTIRLIAKKFS